IWNHYRFPYALHILDGKIRTLQDKSLDNSKKSDELTMNEIIQILDHQYMSIDDNESLTHHVFFWLCLLCGLRGRDAYRLSRKDLEHY
ncbi:8849_t:CDS:1, partial [Cetraspora pellucida]